MQIIKKIRYLIPFVILILILSLSSCYEETERTSKTTEAEEEVIEETEEGIEEYNAKEEESAIETEELEENKTEEENEDIDVEGIREGEEKSEEESAEEEEAAEEETTEDETEEEEVEELPYQEVTCIRVIDGDTIEIRDNAGNTFKLRYIGIDTPEEGSPYYAESAEANRFLVEGKLLRIERDVSETDQYGRLLRYVYVGDFFINAHLVAEGFAQIMTVPPDVKFSDYFLQLEQDARNNNKGLWGLIVEQEEIQEQQDDTQTTAVGPFLGSINSDVYHYPSCGHAQRIKSYNQIWFNSVEEAKAAGYKPCKVCTPPG